MVFSSTAGIWHVIPGEDSDRLLTVALGESEKRSGSVEYWVETVVRYQITNPRAFLVLNLSGGSTEPQPRTRSQKVQLTWSIAVALQKMVLKRLKSSCR